MDNKLQQTRMMPTDLTYQKLESITNSFSEEHKVGSGGFGEVYKGVLEDGTEIAIKKLRKFLGIDDEQFKREFYNLMKVQHKNIIRLVGYCYEIRHRHVKDARGEYVFARMEERALCFEYLKRGSLDRHLSDESRGLDWHTRYKIIKGICEGLDYLHNGTKDRIYHLDLKPANILLDEDNMPKITDFGLSKLFDSSKTHTTNNIIIGTAGYMPPEYIDKRQVSKKFDVYSLGFIIIQIIAGPSARSICNEMAPEKIIEHVQERWKKRLQVTSRSTTLLEADSLEVKTCIELALRCVEADREKRPTVREIIDQLNELETVRKSLATGKISESKLDHLAIDPLELRFPFEMDRDVSCVLQLTNMSADFVAFTAQANQSKYRTVPDRAIMQPWSKRYIIATLKAQGIAPDRMQSDDLFIFRIARMTSDGGGSMAGDVAEDDFEKVMGKIVDEVRLPVVYVALPPPATPSP